jgi:hypothetical protein
MFTLIKKLLFKKLFRFLGDELMQILNDTRLQNIAIKAVENATKLDLDNDGKSKHVSSVIKAEAKAIGVELKDRYANMLLEAGLNKWKELNK